MEISQIQKRAAVIASDAQALIRELGQLHPAAALEAAQAEAEIGRAAVDKPSSMELNLHHMHDALRGLFLDKHYQAMPSPRTKSLVEMAFADMWPNQVATFSPGSDVVAEPAPTPVEVQNDKVKQMLADIAEAEGKAADVQHEMGFYTVNDRHLETLAGLKKAYEDLAWFLKKQLRETVSVDDPEIVRDGDTFRGSVIKLSGLSLGGIQSLGTKAPIFLLAPVPMEIVVIDGMNQVKEAVYSAEWFYDGAMRKLPYDPVNHAWPIHVRLKNAAGEVKWVVDRDIRVMVVLKQPR